MKVDDLIALIRKVRGLVEKTDAYADQDKMLRALDAWRSYLMKADIEGFNRHFEEFGAKNPDAYDELVDMILSAAGVKTVDELGLSSLEESYKRTFREFIAL